MNDPFVRPDLDGNLAQSGTAPYMTYAKILSSETSWHIIDLDVLKDTPDQLVQHVDVDLDKRTIRIGYHPKIRPLDLNIMRQHANISGLLGNWRVCQIAIQLCKSIQELHQLDVPQSLLHPNRIGVFKNRFVVLPTLAGVLPPFSDFVRKEDCYWMYFMAPEVFRTRGLDQSMFFKGDVYSLGRLLHLLLCEPDWEPDIGNPLSFVEQLVESQKPGSGASQEKKTSSPLDEIVAKMTAFFPGERMDIDEALRAFESLSSTLDPEVVISKFIEKALNKAILALDELEDSIFSIPSEKQFLLKAKTEYAKPVPNYGIVINFLGMALNGDGLSDANIHLFIAETYQKFTGHSQNLPYALRHYLEAGKAIDWVSGAQRQLVLSKMKDIGEALEDPVEVLHNLTAIPPDVRLEEIFVLIFNSYKNLSKYKLAWEKVVEFYIHHCRRFSPDTFHVALEIAGWIEETLLGNYLNYTLREDKNQPGHDLLRAVIWKRLGDPYISSKFLKLAQTKFG